MAAYPPAPPPARLPLQSGGARWACASGGCWGGVTGPPPWGGGFLLRVPGRSSRPFCDGVVGFNRWTRRVIAYVALRRDEYPPFRLDPGETEPEAGTTVAPM